MKRLVCLALLAASSASGTAFLPESWSTVVQPGAGLVAFEITFNRAPDFYSTDSADRQADSFQFYIDSHAPVVLSSFSDAACAGDCLSKSIIRGEEIHFNEGLPIRRVDPSFVDGWGPVVSTVPFRLSNNTISFTLGFDALATDGNFYYNLQTFEYGSTSYFREAIGVSGEHYRYADPVPAPVPIPANFVLMLFGLAFLTMVGRYRGTV